MKYKIYNYMEQEKSAIQMKGIPVLRGKEAQRFIKMADENCNKRNSIDFTEQINTANKILAKSKIK